MPGKSEVDNASWDCFRGRKQKARPQKQSRDALSTSLLPDLLRNSEVANREREFTGLACVPVHYARVMDWSEVNVTQISTALIQKWPWPSGHITN